MNTAKSYKLYLLAFVLIGIVSTSVQVANARGLFTQYSPSFNRVYFNSGYVDPFFAANYYRLAPPQYFEYPRGHYIKNGRIYHSSHINQVDDRIGTVHFHYESGWHHH